MPGTNLAEFVTITLIRASYFMANYYILCSQNTIISKYDMKYSFILTVSFINDEGNCLKYFMYNAGGCTKFKII